VQPVLFPVDQVVQHINSGGQQAEGGEGGQCLAELDRIGPGVSEQQADEDEAVLQPLVRAHQLEQRKHQRRHVSPGKYLSHI
jgi:hypothetical protein